MIDRGMKGNYQSRNTIARKKYKKRKGPREEARSLVSTGKTCRGQVETRGGK
jgi:hypothetical protein